MLSASSSRSSLSCNELVVVVTADGSKPHLPWMDEMDRVAYVDARARRAWPALAELDVPLSRLPRAYVLPQRDENWLRNPRPLKPGRVRAIPL